MRIINLVLAALLLVASGCSKDDNHNSTSTHSDFKKAARMLYEVTYSDYSTVVPNGRYKDMAGDMGCSSVRNGDFVGRNFDYFMNQCPTFVIHTTRKEGRYASIGVGRLAQINETMVENGLPQDKIDFLPWALLDGMNEKGLVVNTNVLSKQDWGGEPHTGTHTDLPELNVLFTPRALLDNCDDVTAALAYLDSHNITPLQSNAMNLQLMISDPEETYVVEFINNEMNARPQYIMTNYHLFFDDIPEHAMGVERYDILKQNYNLGGKSMQDMWTLMTMVRYSNMYKFPAYQWYSECTSYFPYSKLKEKDVLERLNVILTKKAEEWKAEVEYVKQHGLRDKTEYWDTVHNSIYDIRNKKLWVTLHEWDDQKREFVLEF